MDRRDFLGKPAPPGYVAGACRGDYGFVTSGDAAPTGGMRVDASKSEASKPDGRPRARPTDRLTAADAGGAVAYTRDDDAADAVFAHIDARMASRSRVAAVPASDRGKQESLVDRAALASVSVDDWAAIPDDPGDRTAKRRRKDAKEPRSARDAPAPDVLLVAQTPSARFGTVVEDIDDAASARASEGADATRDAERTRRILRAALKASPHDAMLWVAAARADLAANRPRAARQTLADALAAVPHAADVWVLAAELADADDRATVLRRGLAVVAPCNAALLHLLLARALVRDCPRLEIAATDDAPDCAWRREILPWAGDTPVGAEGRADEVYGVVWDIVRELATVASARAVQAVVSEAVRSTPDAHPALWTALSALQPEAGAALRVAEHALSKVPPSPATQPLLCAALRLCVVANAPAERLAPMALVLEARVCAVCALDGPVPEAVMAAFAPGDTHVLAAARWCEGRGNTRAALAIARAYAKGAHAAGDLARGALSASAVDTALLEAALEGSRSPGDRAAVWACIVRSAVDADRRDALVRALGDLCADGGATRALLKQCGDVLRALSVPELVGMLPSAAPVGLRDGCAGGAAVDDCCMHEDAAALVHALAVKAAFCSGGDWARVAWGGDAAFSAEALKRVSARVCALAIALGPGDGCFDAAAAVCTRFPREERTWIALCRRDPGLWPRAFQSLPLSADVAEGYAASCISPTPLEAWLRSSVGGAPLPPARSDARGRTVLEQARMRTPGSERVWAASVLYERDVLVSSERNADRPGALPTEAVRALVERGLQRCPRSERLWAFAVALEGAHSRRARLHTALAQCGIASDACARATPLRLLAAQLDAQPLAALAAVCERDPHSIDARGVLHARDHGRTHTAFEHVRGDPLFSEFRGAAKRVLGVRAWLAMPLSERFLFFVRALRAGVLGISSGDVIV